MDILHSFYCSKPWRTLSFKLKVERGGKCNRCNNIFDDMKYLIGHHTIELTEDNVHDSSISLNPVLIEIICHDCHNKEHRRFGNSHNVYIVYGSPLSGKTSLVMDLMKYGDIVLDLDALWKAVSFQPEYIKPNNLRFNVFAIRDTILDQIKTRYGEWNDAYIIGGYPEKYERERLAQSLGAEIIYCESTKEECINRLRTSGKSDKWIKYVNDWWDIAG